MSAISYILSKPRFSSFVIYFPSYLTTVLALGFQFCNTNSGGLGNYIFGGSLIFTFSLVKSFFRVRYFFTETFSLGAPGHLVGTT